MTEKKRKHPRRFALFYTAYLLLLLVGITALAELALRSEGWLPWQVLTFDNIQIEPGGTLFLQDNELGFRMRPGQFTVHLAPDFQFSLTHGPDGLRQTRFDGTAATPEMPEMWLAGCSFTHGWSVNDEEAWPSQVQAALPAWDVHNFGVSAYGQVQSRLLYDRAVKERGTPDLLVLTYASFHDMRNVYSRTWQKLLSPGDHLGNRAWPYFRMDAAGHLKAQWGDAIEYWEPPLIRQLAVVQYLDERYNARQDASLRANDVSQRLLLQWAEHCRKQGVDFLVGILTRDPLTARVVRFLDNEKIPAVDLSVDYLLPEMTNLPVDLHPSAQAHQIFATRLLEHLQPAGLSATGNSSTAP